MRRRSKIARLSGGAVGVEDQLVVAQTQARQAGRLAALDAPVFCGKDLRERVLGILCTPHSMPVFPCH